MRGGGPGSMPEAAPDLIQGCDGGSASRVVSGQDHRSGDKGACWHKVTTGGGGPGVTSTPYQ